MKEGFTVTDDTGVTGAPTLTMEQKMDTVLDVLARHQRGLIQVESEVFALRFTIVLAIVLAGAVYVKYGRGVK